MKRVLLTVICLSAMLFLVNIAVADTKDGILQIPKAHVKPEIDGVMDPVWYSASFERAIRLDGADSTPPDGFLDLHATLRALWDDTKLYLFLHVIDDVLRTDAANTWEDDSWEFYFDANNSKTVGSYDQVDDVQLRIGYDDVDNAGIDVGYAGSGWNYDKSGIVYNPAKDWERATKRTEPIGTPVGEASGWVLEVSFPLEALQIEPAVGTIFGFDVQLNENDTGARDDMFRWWATSNDEWHWAELFGTAELTGYLASDPMIIPKTITAPVIDGVLDDAWLDNSVLIQAEEFNLRNGATIPSEFNDLENWDDLQVAYRVMWDETAFYFWLEIIDDVIYNAHANAWENDGVELYFDGDNSKGTSFDTNDKQWRWVWGKTAKGTPGGTDEFIWAELPIDTTNYTLELKIPAAELPFTLEQGAVIGWEVQVNENDGANRKNMIRWWGEDNMSWVQPVLWGTAELGPTIQEMGMAVKARPGAVVSEFELSQNYPNPFNPSTSINYSIPKMSEVTLKVYDILGKEVAQLVNKVQTAGSYSVSFDASNLTSGVYFYKLQAGAYATTKKMMFLK